MKLIDIMRQYNKCVLRENAKLKSIYILASSLDPEKSTL